MAKAKDGAVYEDKPETTMKYVKPSVNGLGNTGYLGHFAKDEYIQQGHNDTPTPRDDDERRRQLENSVDSKFGKYTNAGNKETDDDKPKKTVLQIIGGPLSR